MGSPHKPPTLCVGLLGEKKKGNDLVKLGIIGCGNIGRFIMKNLSRDDFQEFSLVVISDRPESEDQLKELAARYGCDYTTDPASLADRGLDVVMETATPAAVRQYVPALLKAGVNVLAMSVGAFADGALMDEARRAAEEGDAEAAASHRRHRRIG